MAWHVVVQLVDAADTVLATEDVVSTRDATWKIPVKTALQQVEAKYPALPWTKALITIKQA